MDRQQIHKVPILGIILLILGIGLFLKQLRIFQIDGTAFLFFGVTLYGLAAVGRAFFLNVRRQIFFGSLCFYGGILLLLGKYELIERSPFIYVPGFLIVFGLAFLSLFIYHSKDFHLLVPAFIFILLGAAFMMTEVGYWYVSDVKDAIGKYWPAALIIFGGLMLLRRRERPVPTEKEKIP